MKKFRILFLPVIIISLFTLNSCGSDEPIDGFVEDTSGIDPNNPDGGGSPSESVILLKKEIATDADGKKITTIFSYNGTKLISVVDDSGDSNIYITYTGDLITKFQYRFPDGTIDQENFFTYNADGKLATHIRINNSIVGKLGNKEVFTYNADGTVSVKGYIGDDISQTQENSDYTVKFLNGEVSEIIDSDGSDHKYTYDTKNYSLKNVLGFSKLAFIDGEATGGILHNTISDISGGQVLYNYSYTYNSNSYPETGVEIDETGEKTTLQYFY